MVLVTEPGLQKEEVNLAKVKAQYAPLADVYEIALREKEYRGQKLALAGTVLTVEEREGQTHLTMEAGQPGESRGAADEFEVAYPGALPGLRPGTWARVWGTCQGLYIQASRACGLTMRPLIGAEILEW